jgi:hypothetical protein
MRLTTSLPIGQQAPAVVGRDGKEIVLVLTPRERGELYPKQQELKSWGVTVRNISFLLAKVQTEHTPALLLIGIF